MNKFEKYPLQIKYRPTSLEEMVGNESVIESLRSCLERPSGVPHTFLFQGPSGCGKTTLARIVAGKLNSAPEEIKEYNISKMRGIDTAREIIDSCSYPPLRGKVKVFILNECFHQDTPILTSKGFFPIKEIKVGDLVLGLPGYQKVKTIFQNKVPLSRIVKVIFKDGKEIICSEDHLFFTYSDWVEAKNLKGHTTKIIEGDNTIRVKVENVEFYKQGSNDGLFGSFVGIVKDKERGQGYIEFYDLEIEGHPSYYANEVLVHNCHKSTNEFQNAILEILEEPPKHVFFILVTTDPEKLLKTVKTRCSIFQVGSLQRAKIMKLLRLVCAQEKVEVSQAILQKISEYCDGSPRQALVILDQIIDIEDEETALQAVLDSTIHESSVLELCQMLLKKGTSWKTLSIALKSIDDEPEKVRYAILSYMTKVLLDTPSDRVPQIIDVFSTSWMYSGKAGLVMSCYLVTKL